MAYRRSSRGYSRRSSGFASRGRSAGYRRSAPRTRGRGKSRAVKGQQTVRLILETAPASGVSRMQERVLTKMNPPPTKAKY